MRPWAWCLTQSSETSECPTWRRGDAVPCRRLTLDGHGQEFSLGREAVLCVVFHELILIQVGVHNDVALRETYSCALTSWNFIGTWDFEPTILLRRVLCMERLYIIWGYSVAMWTTGFSWFGWYRIGPFRVMRALLFSISTENSGGPKLAVWNDKTIYKC